MGASGPRQDYLALFGLAARLLGWSPGVFWSATPREMAAALKAAAGGRSASAARPMSRAELHALLARFPDRNSQPAPTGDEGAQSRG